MSSLCKTCFFGFLIGIVGLMVSFFPLMHEIEEDAGLGLLFKLRGARKAPSDVVIVSIGTESSEQLKISESPNQWPRSLHAQLVDNLARAGARVR